MPRWGRKIRQGQRKVRKFILSQGKLIFWRKVRENWNDLTLLIYYHGRLKEIFQLKLVKEMAVREGSGWYYMWHFVLLGQGNFVFIRENSEFWKVISVATMLEFVLSGCHKRCKSSWMYKYMWCSFIAIFVARKPNMYVKPCRVGGNNFWYQSVDIIIGFKSNSHWFISFFMFFADKVTALTDLYRYLESLSESQLRTVIVNCVDFCKHRLSEDFSPLVQVLQVKNYNIAGDQITY